MRVSKALTQKLFQSQSPNKLTYRISRHVKPKLLSKKVSCNSTDPGSALVQVATTIKATGVPLLEELMQLSAPAATAKATMLITRAAVIGIVGVILLGSLHAKLCSLEKQQTDFRVIISPLASVTKPALVLLPYYIFARIATIVSALLEVMAVKLRPELDVITRDHSDMMLCVTKRITQFLQDTSELVAIGFVAWFLSRLLERIVNATRLRLLREPGDGEPTNMTRLLDSAGAVLSWGIWGVATAAALMAYGVDLRPLLASLGASSIIIGIAAQSILSNLVSGISLYTSPAFRVGDQIQLVTVNGATVTSGVVQVISPTRTILRDSNDGALVYMNNSDVAKMVVRNESKTVMVTSPP